jgi:hypothetical protein
MEESPHTPFAVDIFEIMMRKIRETVDAERFLTRLLERRFGPLPEVIRERIDDASVEEMENWAIRALNGQSLEDIFAG